MKPSRNGTPASAADARPDVLLLGPHPSRCSISIETYFSDLRAELIDKTGLHIDSRNPGCEPARDHAVWAWTDIYVRWPVVLRRSTAGLFHIMDQGLGWYAALLRQQRFVVTVHDLLDLLTMRRNLPFPTPPVRRRPLIRASAAALSRAAHLIAHSRYTADLLHTELGFPTASITVVPQVLNQRFKPPDACDRQRLRSRLGCGEFPVVLYVGSAAPHKNRTNLLRAFALLHTRSPQARLILISSGPTPEEERLIAASDIVDFVHFLSPVPAEQLPHFYGSADVLVFPSLCEGVGRPPIEAMACGCPVISSTRGGLLEVVQDSAMSLLDPCDHTEIADKLYRVLTTPQLALELRNRGLERAAQYRREHPVPTLQAIYRSLL